MKPITEAMYNLLKNDLDTVFKIYGYKFNRLHGNATDLIDEINNHLNTEYHCHSWSLEKNFKIKNRDCTSKFYFDGTFKIFDDTINYTDEFINKNKKYATYYTPNSFKWYKFSNQELRELLRHIEIFFSDHRLYNDEVNYEI